MVLDLIAQLDRESTERHKIEAMLRELLDARRNRKSEQLSTDQLALFALAWQARQAEAEPTKPDGSAVDDPNANSGADELALKKRTGGRQALPRHLKRERIVHDLVETERHCSTCQQDLRLIGEESSERYEYIPAQLTVIEDVCKKYACACTVKTATKPPQPIEKSTAGASLLAQVIVAKCVDHLPLHRQEKIFEKPWRGDLAQGHGRLAGTVRRSAEDAVWIQEVSTVPVQGDRDRRHQREGAGCKVAVRAHRAHVAVLRRCGPPGDPL